MVLRIFAFFILLFSVLFLPYYVSVILALAGIVYFLFYLEAPILMLLSDLLCGAKEGRFLNITFLSTIVFIVILIVAGVLKKKLKFYQK